MELTEIGQWKQQWYNPANNQDTAQYALSNFTLPIFQILTTCRPTSPPVATPSVSSPTVAPVNPAYLPYGTQQQIGGVAPSGAVGIGEVLDPSTVLSGRIKNIKYIAHSCKRTKSEQMRGNSSFVVG
jgi:hypothetical protein